MASRWNTDGPARGKRHVGLPRMSRVLSFASSVPMYARDSRLRRPRPGMADARQEMRPSAPVSVFSTVETGELAK